MVPACLLLLLVLAAEPQCPIDVYSCVKSFIPEMLYEYSGSNNDQVCNTTTWMVEDYCYKLCPMRLVITEPADLRTWFCLTDNLFEPYAPDAHVDLYHPLNNQVLEIEAVGQGDVGTTQAGCEASDYAFGNKSFAGKIVLNRRGTCYDSRKAQVAQEAGAAMLVVVNNIPYSDFLQISGSTEGIEAFPTLTASRKEADYVLAALDRGVKVKGKFQYQCNDMPAGYLDNPQDYPWDRCPRSRMALYNTCTKLDKAQEPLCEVCTVELQLPGAEKLCLFGNQLLPRRRETLMHTSWGLPYAAEQEEVVYATELANGGCAVSDYAGLAGKILIMPQAGGCTLIMTVRSAEQAGVKAYIMVTVPYHLQWYRVYGSSQHTRIPVHTVDYHAKLKLQAYIKAGGGRHIPGSGYALGAMNFTRGVPPPTEPPTPAPLPEVVVDTGPHPDRSPDFELSGGMVACITVVCIDVAALVVLFVRQQRDAVQLPDVQVTAFSIPLNAASTGLSLTLLILMAAVSFSLATVAGQDSTHNAIDNGRAALGLAYASSEEITIELSNTIRKTAIDGVLAALRNEVQVMEGRLELVADLFFKYNGSWAQFNERSETLFRLMRVGHFKHPVLMQVFTTRGFFLNHNHKTDDRPDALRNDGVVGSIAETNEGWRYGVNEYDMDSTTLDFRISSTKPVYEQNASRMLAGNIGDPLAVTAGKPAGHTTWLAAKLTFPLWFHTLHPMAVYRPLHGLNGEYHGTIEAHAGLDAFMASSLGALVLSGTLQNMSVMLVDADDDKAILGQRNTGTPTSYPEGVVPVVVGAHALSGLYNMREHPSIAVTALANYLDSVGGWAEHEGVFDQKEHFVEQPHSTLAHITASGGRAADTGVHNWDVEMRDGACGACVVYDEQLQKQVLVFDGATTMHIYRNMTRRTPVVAKSKVSVLGEPWRSRYEVFGDTLTLGDGTECVARTWNTTATDSVKMCMARPDISVLGAYMVSLRIRPDVAYTETSPRATTPRLFSDTLVGDANIRLFANGQLYLFVLRHGCRTKAYEGGFPVGVWTTVTASVGGGYCRVYVNGTLYSQGPDARWGPRYHISPYRTGQFFKGRMDSLQLFSSNMSAEEVRSLHTTDKLVRTVRTKWFFAQTKALDMNVLQQREGVRWMVAVMIPRDDIMRVVDANRRDTLADVQVHEDNTNKELKQRANATIMIIVAIAMTSVVVFLVFNTMITRPVAEFAQDILRLSQVDVEGVKAVEGSMSLLREINVMRCAVNVLVENMREYKTFMPEAIFANELAFTDTQAQVAPGLDTGHAAVLFTDVQGSTRLWEACTDDMAVALQLHNKVMREVIAEHDGYEVKTIGDAFMVAFADLDAAVCFGLQAQERLFRAAWPAGLLEAVQAPGDEERGLHGLRVRMGVTQGAVTVERNDVLQRCDYFGPTVNRAARLESNGVCGGLTVEVASLPSITDVQQQAVVVPLGARSLKGIGDVPLCVLVPKSIPQRAVHMHETDLPFEPWQPLDRCSSIGSGTSMASTLTTVSTTSNGSMPRHRPHLKAMERFGNRLSEVGIATTACLDCEVADAPAAEVTELADSNLRAVVACLGRSDGRLLNVCGTAALAAWNVRAPCTGHLEAALRFVTLAVGVAANVRCGLSSGKVFSGYIGAGKQRFVTAVGECVQLSLGLHVMALQADQAVLFAARDTQVAAAMQARGLATAAGELRRGDRLYTVCAVLCGVVAARLDSREGLFSTDRAGEQGSRPA